MFLDQLLRQSVLTHWLVQRRRQHRVSLGLPVGALDPVERMFSKFSGLLPASPPAGSEGDPPPKPVTTVGRDHNSGQIGAKRGSGGLRQLPQRWTVHMDAQEASEMGLLRETHSRTVREQPS